MTFRSEFACQVYLQLVCRDPNPKSRAENLCDWFHTLTSVLTSFSNHAESKNKRTQTQDAAESLTIALSFHQVTVWSLGVGLDVLESLSDPTDAQRPLYQRDPLSDPTDRQRSLYKDMDTAMTRLLVQMLEHHATLGISSGLSDTYQCLSYRAFRLLTNPRALIQTWVRQSCVEKEEEEGLVPLTKPWKMSLEMLLIHQKLPKFLHDIFVGFVDHLSSSSIEPGRRWIQLNRYEYLNIFSYSYLFRYSYSDIYSNIPSYIYSDMNIFPNIHIPNIHIFIYSEIHIFEYSYSNSRRDLYRRTGPGAVESRQCRARGIF